jgi:hypothetical protein
MARPALLRSPPVIRFRFLGTALALSAIVGTLVHAQLTDEEKKKRDARSKAREEMRAIASPTPSETPEPTAKPKPADRKSKAKKHSTPKPKATPTPTPKAKKSPTPEPDESPSPKSKEKSAAKKSTDEEDEEATPKPKATEKKKAESPEPSKTPALKKKPTPAPEESPTPKSKAPEKKKTNAKKEATPTPKPTPKPEPSKSPTPVEKSKPPAIEPERAPSPTPRPPPAPPQSRVAPPADITVEKSGLEKEQGFEPPPPAPPRSGFWPWSRQTTYKYLTSATIDAIRRAPVQRARWKFIIVHNSGTRQGNARAFDYYHRRIRRMKNGLAYHFVIGNGTSSRNGQIEIGDRWVHQLRGGHVHSDYMNNIGLGICLVGDFNRDQPTRAQLEACEELIRYLRTRCGKADGAEMAVRPHREVNPPRWATDCPGNVFPYPWFGRFR